MHRILLTGIGSPASQNVLNSLRDAPEPFYIVGTDLNKYHLEWGNLERAYEAPLTDSPEYLPFLLQIIEQEKIEFVHGQPDWEVAWLSKHAKLLPARTFLPRPEVVAVCQDKAASAKFWFENGLRRDPLRLVNRPEEIYAMAEELGLPFWLRASSGAGARGSCRVDTPEHGFHWLSYWKARKVDWQFMAQEFLPGEEFAFQSVWKEGKLITSAVRERLEFIFPQHAPSGVTSSPVVARSVHNAPVNDVATRAILTLDAKPNGIYCVDLKCDKEGTPRPTEINSGRFFTTSYFFTKAGANMPYQYVLLGLGRAPRPMPQYDAVPADLYWIRHIDCDNVLIEEGKWRAILRKKSGGKD